MEWKQGFARLIKAKDQNEAKKTRNYLVWKTSKNCPIQFNINFLRLRLVIIEQVWFFKEYFLCLWILRKNWSLVRVEVLGKNQQSHTWGQNHRTAGKIVAWTDSIDSSINQVSSAWEKLVVTRLVFHSHVIINTTTFGQRRLTDICYVPPAESYFACFIMQEIITKSTSSITFFCLRKSIGDLNSCKISGFSSPAFIANNIYM